MTDVWELAAYVESHPSNHGQRWRLAKKLYTAFEYRLALEHLLILKNETDPRENVMRYLAATYFRLGRHEEAIKALEESLSVWPKDAGLREQLARSQHEAGDHVEALASWRRVQELEPNHAYAATAIARLQIIVEREAQEKKHSAVPARVAAPGTIVSASANAPAAAADLTCTKCGTKNSTTFKTCWQCGAAFGSGGDFLDEVIEKAEQAEPYRPPSPIAVGLVLAGIFAVGVYGALRGLARVSQIAASPDATTNFSDAVDPALFLTRILIGFALAIVWPAAWWLGASAAKVGHRVFDTVLLQAGALLALLTFALLWLPWGWIAATLLVPVLLSAFIAFILLRVPPAQAAILWATQLALAAFIVIMVIAGRHGPRLIFDLPLIVGFVRDAQDRTPFEATFIAPGTLRVEWHSSGSPWLDTRIHHARLTVKSAPKEKRIFLETLQGGKQLFFEQVGLNTHRRDLSKIRIGTPYAFDLSARAESDVRVKLESLLPFTAQAPASGTLAPPVN